MIYRLTVFVFAFVSLFALSGCGGVGSVANQSGNQAATQIPILNASFDQVSPAGALVAWTASEHNQGNSYTFQADSNGAWSAPSSVKINRYGPEDFGLLSQQIRVQPGWDNKTVRLSAQLKTGGAVDAGAGLILQMNGSGGDINAWNHMSATRVMQTQAWKSYSIDLKVVPGTYSIKVGVMLEGSGTLWADDLKLEIID
jgi:outer membrane murein-binding lipoprotein Lpp